MALDDRSGRVVVQEPEPRFQVRPGVRRSRRPVRPDQRLSLVIGDRTIEELEIDTTEVVYVTCEIPAADLGSDDIVNLELRVDRTFTPADIGDGPQDTRELGVRVYYTYFEPL